MKIVVIGGSGLIGKKLVKKLRDGGHEVVAASPSSGVNTVTGEGLAQALAGARVVVDVANALLGRTRQSWNSFETSGRNLLAAGRLPGCGIMWRCRLSARSGCLASGYFRAKMAQEKLIKASPIPYTIVRATQFFEFVGGIAQFATEGQTVRLPAALMQPIASDDVAAILADVAVAEPLNGTMDIAGPEPIRMDELVRQFFKRDRRRTRSRHRSQGALLRPNGGRPLSVAGRKPTPRSDPLCGLACRKSQVDPLNNPASANRRAAAKSM